ncbi:MAG: hypothetical protein NZ455_01150 [Bacteroidia bacterium]|nr:hypothetical protein [Bacteroidia bacterium]MDW8346610.1 hypothetical protein [Bacteroidia bacterium]
MRRVRSSAQHRSDSVARSTPTLPTRAQRDVGKDTPKKLRTLLAKMNFYAKQKNIFFWRVSCRTRVRAFNTALRFVMLLIALSHSFY